MSKYLEWYGMTLSLKKQNWVFLISIFFFQHCWTPLLLAAKENASEIVNKLLDRKPNVNATDKDGCTALTLACKEGYHDICMALLNAGAYVNLQVSLIFQNRFLFSNLNLILLSNRIEVVIPT
jgi:ankyrin repeat protein